MYPDGYFRNIGNRLEFSILLIVRYFDLKFTNNAKSKLRELRYR